MFDAKKTAEELVKLGSSRGDGWLEIDGLVIYMGPLAKAKSLRAALLVPVAAALSQAYAEGVAGAAKAASGVSSVGYDGMCYYDLSSNPLKRKERTMADPMTKEKRAELRKLAEAATPGPWTATKDFKRYWIECAGQKICGGNAIGEISNDDTDADEAAANAGHVAAANPTVLLSLLDTLDAAEAEAGRLRKVVKRYKKAAEKVMPELSAMYNQLTGERLMRADPQHAVLIAYKMLEAARAAQGTSDAGKGETK